MKNGSKKMKLHFVKRVLSICLILLLGNFATFLAIADENKFGPPPPSSIPGASSEFSYAQTPENELILGTDSLISADSAIQSTSSNGGGHGSGGNKLGNAPDALFRVLENFLARGRMPPPQFPVPYVVYTLSDGVEKFTNVLTKMPIMINVDDAFGTGQGGKDIRVKTTIDVTPLRITSTVERLGTSNPTNLTVLVTFPAFFYTGESGAPDGNPYWQFGYETQPGNGIPEDVTMTFSVDVSVGSDHTFDFDWSSTSGIPELGFIFGTFQVADGDVTTPLLPAFSNFVVSSPPSAFLTFETIETETATTKCMYWNAPQPFFLQFTYGEIEEIEGLNFEYNMNTTIDEVPQTFNACTTEDRAAGTYSVDYITSSTVDVLEIATNIIVESVPTVEILLRIEDMPEEIHAELGDGYFNVDVSQNVGLLLLEATADLGLAGIDLMINMQLMLVDIPDFMATWSPVSFTLNAATCLGKIQFAFSTGLLTYPMEHDSQPDSHYLFAYSVPGTTALALRIHQLRSIAFVQDNNDGSNTLELEMCDSRVMYVIAHTEVASLLTPERNADLRVVIDSIPTMMNISWTVPFTLDIQTNAAIASIMGNLTLEEPGDTLDLTAYVEILDIPANMEWGIDPGGSIAFTADASIGSLELEAFDPSGLVNAGTFFGGEPIRLLRLLMHDIPSFTAAWSAETVTPQTSIDFNTAPGTGLGDVTFAVSTSEEDYVIFFAPTIENRGLLYNDDMIDLGNGEVMEASLWIHAEDTSTVEMEWGGSSPTIHVGFAATEPHELRASVVLDGTSALNPAAPRSLTGTVQTSALPTSMNMTTTTGTFQYIASGEIDLVTLDLTIGEAPSLDIDHIYGEIEGLPAHVNASWSSGSFSATLFDRLDRVLVTLDNEDGIFGLDLKHVEIEVLDIPASFNAMWDINARTGTLSFLGGTYSEGLGDFRFLATTGNEAQTTNYINSLGIVLPSMTDYGTFTEGIDDDYWPSTVPARLDALYTRQPSLDTAADDYFVYRTGGGFKVYAGRLREIGDVNVDLMSPGFADLEFSRNTFLARQLYLMMDNLDSDKMTVAEVSQLPDGLPTNFLQADWNSAENEYGYLLSETIDYIDIYDGQHDSTSLTSSYMKILLQDVPVSVFIDYNFTAREGFFDFIASSIWQMGYLNQGGNNRYVGWLQMQSLHFDYSFALPGEEPADSLSGYDWSWGYRIFRLDTTLEAIGADADGILGIYNLKPGLDNLDDGTPPRASEYIPQWTFILDDFHIFDIHILWDVGIGIDFGSISIDWDEFSIDVNAPSVAVLILPNIDILADFNLIADFWWNSQIAESVGPLKIPFPVLSFTFAGSLTINEVKDYVDQRPIHLWGPLTADPVIFDWHWDFDADWEWDPPAVNLQITVDITIDVPGFHRMGDHPTPF
jgi:hypothetical protein